MNITCAFITPNLGLNSILIVLLLDPCERESTNGSEELCQLGFVNIAYGNVGRGVRAVVRFPDPKLKTLGERGIKCIFVGYAEHSKAFRKFDESGKGVIICLYVDDMLIFSTDQVQVDLIKEFLSSRFSMKDTWEVDVILAFAVGKLSRYTSNPSTQHWQAIQWISNSEDNSSTRGWVFLLGGGEISWASKKQTCITGSTMKSEFVALAADVKEAQWLRNLILDILLWSKPIEPISICCDSAATLAKAYSQMYNGKSRHLGVRHSMIHELIKNGVISIEFVRSQQNLADHLTKGLARDLVIKSTEGMNNAIEPHIDETVRNWITNQVNNSVTSLTHNIDSLTNVINEMVVTQHFLVNDVNRLKNGEGSSQFSRMSELEFPKFYGEDNKGWIALAWHLQFVKAQSENVTHGQCMKKPFSKGLERYTPLLHIPRNTYKNRNATYPDKPTTTTLALPNTQTVTKYPATSNGVRHLMVIYFGNIQWNLHELEEFADVFAVPTELPPKRSRDPRIPLKDEATMVNIRLYMYPPNQKDVIETMVKELLDSGVSNKAQAAFEKLQQAMTKASVLALPNFKEEFLIETDSLGYGIGAILQQSGHPIAFLSKTLASRHQSLSAYEKYDIVKSIQDGSLITLKYIWKAMGGHSGVQATFKRISYVFYWKGMRKLVKESLFEMLKIGLKFSTAYHLQTNGQTEVVNKCLKGYLRCMTGESPKDWVQWLPSAEYWVELVDRTRQAREKAIDMLKFNLKKTQDMIKVQEHKHMSDREFLVGVWVYLKLHPYKQLIASATTGCKIPSSVPCFSN
nr:zinc finger, CCHC-type [Tanacetum cinerariifolium]